MRLLCLLLNQSDISSSSSRSLSNSKNTLNIYSRYASLLSDPLNLAFPHRKYITYSLNTLQHRSTNPYTQCVTPSFSLSLVWQQWLLGRQQPPQLAPPAASPLVLRPTTHAALTSAMRPKCPLQSVNQPIRRCSPAARNARRPRQLHRNMTRLGSTNMWLWAGMFDENISHITSA